MVISCKAMEHRHHQSISWSMCQVGGTGRNTNQRTTFHSKLLNCRRGRLKKSHWTHGKSKSDWIPRHSHGITVYPMETPMELSSTRPVTMASRRCWRRHGRRISNPPTSWGAAAYDLGVRASILTMVDDIYIVHVIICVSVKMRDISSGKRLQFAMEHITMYS